MLNKLIEGIWDLNPFLFLSPICPKTSEDIHERELDWKGKRLDSDPSANSLENHAHIGAAIEEACNALDKVIPGVRISRDSHYQLANRVSYSWKLASLGIPVLLIYLGFIGDHGIYDLGPPLRSQSHWESLMFDYTRNVLPDGFFNRRIDCGKAAMRMIIRSRPVINQSRSKY